MTGTTHAIRRAQGDYLEDLCYRENIYVGSMHCQGWRMYCVFYCGVKLGTYFYQEYTGECLTPANFAAHIEREWDYNHNDDWNFTRDISAYKAIMAAAINFQVVR